MISAEERKKRLAERQRKRVANREKSGLGSKSILDLSKTSLPIQKFKMQAEKGKDKLIDFIPFTVTEDFLANLREKSGDPTGRIPGDWDYKLEVPVHKQVGSDNLTVICRQLAFGQKCPLCEELFEEWDKEKKDQDAKKIEALKTSWRCHYNVFDYDDQDKGIQLWDDQSWYLFEDMLLEAQETDDEGLQVFWDLGEGKSVSYKTREKSLGGNPFHEAHSIVFVDRDPYDESILEKVHPLDKMLVILNYEEISKIHLGLEDDEVDTRTRRTETPETTDEAVDRTRRGPRQMVRDRTPEVLECPFGHEFGVDINRKEDCNKCDEETFKSCGDAFAAKSAEAKTEQARSEEQTEVTRRRGKSAGTEDKTERRRGRRNI